MGLISWIILGAIAGFAAYRIMGFEGQGCIVSVILGIVGAVVGGVVFRLFGGSGITGFNIYSMVVAIVGAIVILGVARILGGK